MPDPRSRRASARTDLLEHRPTLGAADVPPLLWRAVAVGSAGGLMARKTSFYYSFLVLPADQRRAIIAVWDFCRAVDDAVDEAVDRERARRVAFWRAELARCYDGGRAAKRRRDGAAAVRGAVRAAAPGVRGRDRRRGDGSRHDAVPDVRRALEYCRRVASAVGLICIRIFGCRSAGAGEYAVNLGVALQLTNILRDVKDDLERGARLPAARGPAAAGLHGRGSRGRPDVRAGAELLEFECRRAREFYHACGRGAGPPRIAAGWWRRRSCGRCTSRRCGASSAAGYDVFSGRVAACAGPGRRSSR